MFKFRMQKSKLKITIKNLKFLILILNFAFLVSNFTLTCYAQSDKEDEALFIAKKAYEDGFYEVSIGLLGRFLSNYPGSSKIPEVNLLIGQCYFHQNKFIEALQKFEAILNQAQAKSIKDAVLYWIAEVHFRGNAFSQAADYYKKVIGEFPKSAYAPASMYSLGWCLFQDGKFKEAADYFRSVGEMFPKEPQAQDSYFKEVECFYNLKDYNAVIDKAKGYLKKYPKDLAKIAYIYFYLGEANYYLDNFSEAVSDYNKALSATSDDKMQALSKLGMAWCNLKLKKYKEAESLFADIKEGGLEKRSLDVLLLGQAILYSQTSQYARAQNAYTTLLTATSDPATLVQAYLGKADVLYTIGEYKEAIRIYREGLNKAVSSGEIPQEVIDKLRYGLSWAYLKDGEFKEAISEFQKLVQRTEDKIFKISALCQIGDAYQDSGDYPKAVDAYDQILRDYPDSLYGDYVQYQLGVVLTKMHSYEAAIMAFRALNKNFPNSKLLDDACYALGMAYFQKNDYASSRDVFEKFKTEYKDSSLRPDGLYLLGASLYNLGKYNEAIEVFKDIARSYAQNTETAQKAEYEIADCYYQMGNETEAMARFKALRSKYPDSRLTAEVIWWLGEYYYRHNDPALARRYFTSIVSDFPDSNLVVSAYYALASTYQDESEYQQAIDNLKKVIELDSSDLAAAAAVGIADIYVKQNRPDMALATYKDALSRHANLGYIIYPKIADVYAKIKEYAQALEFYQKSMELVPVKEMSLIQFKIAETKEAQGNTKGAIEDYLKVTYLYSDNSELSVKALLRIGAIYEDQDNFKEALTAYRRVISMNTQEAKYAQERIDWIKKNTK